MKRLAPEGGEHTLSSWCCGRRWKSQPKQNEGGAEGEAGKKVGKGGGKGGSAWCLLRSRKRRRNAASCSCMRRMIHTAQQSKTPQPLLNTKTKRWCSRVCDVVLQLRVCFAQRNTDGRGSALRLQRQNVNAACGWYSNGNAFHLHEPVAAAQRHRVGVGGAEEKRAAKAGEELQGKLQQVALALRV
jgi:hypothetical protein